jgi:hypothetical protein
MTQSETTKSGLFIPSVYSSGLVQDASSEQKSGLDKLVVDEQWRLQ